MDLLLAIGYLIIGGLAVYAFGRLHVRFWRAYYRPDHGPDATHYATTSDGWRLALHRYRPERAARAAPVLLCPGLAVNHRVMDLTPERSLARTLRGLGFDVWILEVRGVGDSTQPGLLQRRSWDITFEDFVDRDAPAAIAWLQAETGAAAVHWIGYGLGGVIGAAVAQRPDSGGLASLTLVGASGRIKLPAGLRFLVSLTWVLSWVPLVPTRGLGALLAPFYISSPLDATLARSANLDPEAARLALAHMAEDVPMSLLRQCSRWAMVGEMISDRDNRNFTRALAQITVPLLGVAADDDHLASPSTVRFAVEKAASARKAYINVGGEGAGARLTLCGHLDLIAGDASARDLFPRLAGWLAQVEGLDLDTLARQAQAARQSREAPKPAPAPSPPPPAVSEVALPEPAAVPLAEEAPEEGAAPEVDEPPAEPAATPAPEGAAASEEAGGGVGDDAEGEVEGAPEPRAPVDHDAGRAAPEAFAEVLAPPALRLDGGEGEAALLLPVPELLPARGGLREVAHAATLEPPPALEASDGALEDLEAAPLPGYDLDGEAPTAKIMRREAPLERLSGLDEGLDAGWGEEWSDDVQALLVAPVAELGGGRPRARAGRPRRRTTGSMRRIAPDEPSASGGRPRPPRLHRSPVSGGDLYEALKDAAARADRALTRPDEVPGWADRLKRSERPPKTVRAVSEEPPEDADLVE